MGEFVSSPLFYGCLLLAYLMGSFPTSYLIGKYIYKINLFEHGSKNVGATNALRVLGKGPGIAVLLIDMAKGVIPVLVAYKVFATQVEAHLLIGVFSIVGHTLSPFLSFKGGKGVATSAGVFLALGPKALGISMLLFVITVALTRYVSLGSIIASFSLPAFSYYFYPQNLPLCATGILIALFIIIKHRANIGRLIRGEENRFQWNKKA